MERVKGGYRRLSDRDPHHARTARVRLPLVVRHRVPPCGAFARTVGGAPRATKERGARPAYHVGARARVPVVT